MEKWQKLFADAKEKYSAAKTLLEGDDVDMEQVKALRSEADALKERAAELKAVSSSIDGIADPQMPAELPTEPDPVPEPEDSRDSAIKAVYQMRYKDVDEPTSRVMREIYDGDYRMKMYEQDVAFQRYLKAGETALTSAQRGLLRQQMWHPDHVRQMLKDGLGVGQIKATMVEGTDVYGGYAVPAERAQEILTRLPGLTAVRAGGARVIQTSSSMIEWLKVTGGGDRYRSAMRGSWGSEASSPGADDFTVGLEQIPVHVYTYKVPFSQSLVEDANNLVEIFTDMVATTLALDEDEAFLVGDGAGKPTGILPDSANGHSLTSPDTGDASAITMDGLKALKRGVAAQYRAPGRASVIGNSSTGLAIEQLKDGDGRYFYESLEVGNTVMGATWRESEAMPDVAGSAFPLIYGDLSGYAIVERLGLSVVRFQDSNTGINKVEYHIRRRIGGDVIEPWKLAVQEVTA